MATFADVKRHLRHKADVNAEDKQYLMTPLHWAALEGHTKVAKVLLAKGADVNAEDEQGGTLLQWAALGGSVETATLLLDSGADVNGGNAGFSGWTAPLETRTQELQSDARMMLGALRSRSRADATVWRTWSRYDEASIGDRVDSDGDHTGRGIRAPSPAEWPQCG